LIEVHLYGKLRRFSDNEDPSNDSIVPVPAEKARTIGDVVTVIGIPPEELSPNIFLNGEYSGLKRPVRDRDRLAIFPEDMQLLYSWYFKKVE